MSFRNLSTTDRILRLALAATMLAFAWGGWAGGVWQIALAIFAWVPLITALLGWCPFYAILGFSTRKPRR